MTLPVVGSGEEIVCDILSIVRFLGFKRGSESVLRVHIKGSSFTSGFDILK